jgi:hypothetical protein
MRGSWHKTTWLLAGAFLVFGLILPAGATQTSTSKHKKKKEEPPPPAPYVPSPLQPLTLDQMPAVAPTVTYQGGLLAIVSPNCTLGDILRAVHKQTGANVDVPANATERVAVRLGPGPAPDVLAALLNGSHFNYIVLGSASDRNQVSQVILTSKTGGAGGAPAAVANNMPPQQGAYPPGAYPGGQPPQVQAQEAADNSDADNMDTSGGDAVEDVSADQSDQQDQSQENAANPGAPGQVKTPEQLLQELQQQQAQQQLLLQQQQQQQTSGQPQTVYPTPTGVPAPPRPGPPQH